MMRAGQEEDDAEDVHPLDKIMGNPQAGEINEEASKSAQFGITSYDSHADVSEYGRAITYLGRNAAREQAVRNQYGRANAALVPLGQSEQAPANRPVLSSNGGQELPPPQLAANEIAIHGGGTVVIAGDGSTYGASPSMAAYLRSHGVKLGEQAW